MEARGLLFFEHVIPPIGFMEEFIGSIGLGYNVVAMDPDYENALIFGESKDYIWFLSRNKTMPGQVKQKFLKLAHDAGYDLDRLVWTKQ
ncbi:UNVERIFIED_CONTAM: blc [Trichonephila clavipes]